MGTEQSSFHDKEMNSQESTRKCYYDVLGVGQKASSDEIKKAFRAKALEVHPDRNYGDVDNATKKFAELQSAYEILSDLQERAWYDSHRNELLQDCGSYADDQIKLNVRLTSAKDIFGMINNLSSGMTGKPNSFFDIYRSIFAIIAEEETAACELNCLESKFYPSFGNAGDSYEDVVQPFYAAWIGFATKKTFSWKDVYKYSDAHDRQTRRLMEKKNKQLRDEGVKEFNDAVRSLVKFVRNRDRRYIWTFQSVDERQKSLRDAAAAQAARSRAANQAKLDAQEIPKWAQAGDIGEETTSPEPESSPKDVYECIACAKIFKSENQYEAHEKSKKHIKAIRSLTREVQKENKRLNIQSEASNCGKITERVNFRHGSSNSCVQSPPQTRRSSSDYRCSDGFQNATMESHTGSGTKLQESGEPVGIVSTSEGDEIDDEYSSRKRHN